MHALEGLIIIVHLNSVHWETLLVGIAGNQAKQLLWGQRLWTLQEEVGGKKTTMA